MLIVKSDFAGVKREAERERGMNPEFVAPHTRALFFDAVGTLIHPHPSAIDVYLEIGQKYGVTLPRPTIAERFRRTFEQEEARDQRAGWRVDEERERQRWSNIVRGVFAELADPTSLFDELWEHFARPEAWQVAEDVAAVLRAAHSDTLVLGVASNFDRRLHRILDGHASLAGLPHRVISSEVGWRKPSPRFFEAVIRAARCDPQAIVYVGDRPDLDVAGAQAAGLNAVLLAGDTRAPNGYRSIHRLGEIL